MRFTTFTTATLLASIAGFAPAALAADFSLGPLRGTQYGAPMGQTHMWEGGYFGAFAGVTHGETIFRNGLRDQIRHEQRLSTFEGNVQTANWLSLAKANGRANTFGFFGGLNYQYDEAVLGFEVDFTRVHLTMKSEDALTRVVPLDGLFDNNNQDLSGQTGNTTISGSSSVRLKNLATLRARAGYTMGSFLPFVTAGVAFTDYTITHSAFRAIDGLGTTQIANSSKSRIGLGLAAGLGVDVAVTENAFLRAEWQYAVFPSLDGIRVNVNNIRAAAGVKF